MIADLKPYPAVKDSGVPWLGEVPEHWNVKPLKRVCSRSALYGANVAATSYTATGVRFLRTTDITDDGQLKSAGVFVPEESVRDYMLADGDVLISRSGTIGRSFLYASKAHGSCAYAGYLVRFVPASDVLPKYVFLFTKTQAFADFLRVMAISSTIENVNGEKYANAALPLPPLPEQSAIVRFLDRADRRIRRYIRAKQKLIKVLAEQKQAIIHRAVTRGLDPNVRIKSSANQWFPEIPGHWEVLPMRRVIQRAVDGPHHSPDYLDAGIPFLSARNIKVDRWSLKDAKFISESDYGEFCKRVTPKPGDVLYTKGEFGGVKVSEASLNGFPSNLIADRIQEEPYRFLICADKFQTGYDEPLLHTMYVDKPLSGIKAVQTLSRLNRAHPQKHDVFVLDFMNDADTIKEAFSDYYRTTVLSEETDPNKLHDLMRDLDGYQVYTHEQVEQLVTQYLGGVERDRLDPILDACVEIYKKQLDEDGQVDFKGKAKAFARTYAFLASILPYTNVEWEKLSIFLNFLISKLPAPKEEDLSKGILETIDMDSYRVEAQSALSIKLPDKDAAIDPVPMGGGGGKPEPELDRLSNILKTFNNQFGNIRWSDEDRVRRLITQEIPDKVAADTAFQNARKHSDRQNARIEHDKALVRVMTAVLKDDAELFKQFSDNDSFRKWLADTVFALTYQ